MAKDSKQHDPEPEPLTQEQKRALALDNVKRKSKNFHILFTSPVGAKVLEYLEDEFDQEEIFQAGVPDGTAYNLGRRDVIVYIRQMIRVTENA
jgi:hypothetical protein